jgi:antitoxin CptB
MDVHQLDPRRKRARFRSWHRGMREMDLILGPFADRELGALTLPELEQYENLLDIPDAELLGWVTGARTAPPAWAESLLDRIKASIRS